MLIINDILIINWLDNQLDNKIEQQTSTWTKHSHPKQD